MNDTCVVCNATDVRLYRPAGEFFRPERMVCAPCARANSTERNSAWDVMEIGVYVPLVRSDGPGHEPWGYGNLTEDVLKPWLALPETR